MLLSAECVLGFEKLNEVSESLLFRDLRFRLDAEFFLDEVEKIYVNEGLPSLDGVAAIRRLQGSVRHFEQILDSGLKLEPGHESTI